MSTTIATSPARPGSPATTDLRATARRLVGGGRSISPPTRASRRCRNAWRRPASTASAEQRRAYRELLVTTERLSDGVNGVIFCDETLRQRFADGRSFGEGLTEAGIPARDKGGHRRETAGRSGRRDRHRGSGRARRPGRGVRRARRAVREVAGGDPGGRGRPPVLLGGAGERARAGPLRHDLPGGGPGADRGARGAGRGRARAGPDGGGHRPGPRRGRPRAERRRSRPRPGWC